jgi:hypothetical protein
MSRALFGLVEFRLMQKDWLYASQRNGQDAITSVAQCSIDWRLSYDEHLLGSGPPVTTTFSDRFTRIRPTLPDYLPHPGLQHRSSP